MGSADTRPGMSRRQFLVTGAMTGTVLPLIATPAVAENVFCPPDPQPFTNSADDSRRRAFAASLAGSGRKVVRKRSTIRGEVVEYDATLGAIELRDQDEQSSAYFVYTAYVRAGADSTHRPITFAWGGGPSAASTSFHFGSLGPRLHSEETGQFTDNALSILDRSDLVMVDPVGTGWSVPAGNYDYDDFYSVTRDAESVEQFVRRYLEAEGRMEAPLYLAGRSYGTVRLPSVVHYLVEEGLKIDGVIPVAPAIDGNAFWESSGNMASYYLMLPNYAAIAWHHKRQANPAATALLALEEAADFALNDYIAALMTWHDPGAERRQAVLDRLHALTGIRQDVWAEHRLRINGRLFATEFLRDEGKVVRSSDGRMSRPAEPPPEAPPEGEVPSEPSWVDVYFRDELAVHDAPLYRMIAPGLDKVAWPVDRRGVYELAHFKVTVLPNFLDDIAEAMKANPEMRVQQHSGIYDLQSSSFPADWSLANMDIPDELRKNVAMFDYEAGHGVYDSASNLEQFLRNLADFYPS